MNTPVQKVAAIHDLSGFGRASLTVIIPILSRMGILLERILDTLMAPVQTVSYELF